MSDLWSSPPIDAQTKCRKAARLFAGSADRTGHRRGSDDQALTSTGDYADVGAIDYANVHTTTAWDITVDDLHTFHVLAGDTDILVHNCGNTTAPRTTGGAGPVRVGQAGEAAVRGVYDIGPKATVSINGRTRILDGLSDRAVTEVKNVQSLSLTQQIRDNIDYAAQTGRRLDIYVRPSSHPSGQTYLSGPLLDAIERSNGGIQLRFIPQ